MRQIAIRSNFIQKGLVSSVCLMLILISGCKKEITPVLQSHPTTYLNFYYAAEAINGDETLRKNNFVFVNDSLPNKAIGTYPSFSPFISDNRQYPTDITGTTGIIDNVVLPIGAGYEVFYWMPLKPDSYKFIYSAAEKFYLKDTTFTLRPDDRRALYLSESPAADNAYSIIAVPEERKTITGKVRVKIVHIAPDAGACDIKRVTATANESQGLPQKIAFGGYSDYVELDTAGVSKTRNNILIRFYRASSATESILTAAVPAIPGSSFVLVLQGFKQETVRRVLTAQLGGTKTYSTVTVQPNLRVNIRRSN